MSDGSRCGATPIGSGSAIRPIPISYLSMPIDDCTIAVVCVYVCMSPRGTGFVARVPNTFLIFYIIFVN